MPLLLLQETGVTLAQRRRCGTRDGAFLHLCNLSGFFWIWSFYTKRARGESEIPATALDVFTDKADPAWDDFDVAKRFSCRDRCI